MNEAFLDSDWCSYGPTDSVPDPTLVEGGHHHIGTTRMASGPDRGVVDTDCKVFGIANFYVAGSSTFPTLGSANPTLTVSAMALRLADHIDRLV
jgi:choline dehydrogenase-like flavoprotein